MNSFQAPSFKVGDFVTYEGKTYRFPGQVCGLTDDGQVIVRATGAPNGDYAGMKHIYGPSQLQRGVKIGFGVETPDKKG